MVAHVRNTLKELPPTLDDTYLRILRNINKSYRLQVRDVLKMLAFSNRPLRLEEIVEALAFNLDTKSFDEDWRLEPLDVIEICSSLVAVVDPQVKDEGQHEDGNHEETMADDPNVSKKELRFAHYSVKEFLVSERTSTNWFHISEESAHALIADRCIHYLLCHLDMSEDLTRQHLLEYPFLEYAARNWYKHACLLETMDGNLNALIMQLFYPALNCCFQNWLKIWDPDREWAGVLPKEPELIVQPLYYTALIGFIDATNELITKGENVSVTGGYYGNPLCAASVNGHLEVVKFLVEEGGADVESKSNTGRTALSFAAYNGRLDVVEFLVEEGGADVESKDNYGQTPLSFAAAMGRLEAVKFLVEQGGADVESKDGKWGKTALDVARRGIWEGWRWGDPEGRKAVAAWLEEHSRITNRGSKGNVNDGG